MPPCHDPVFIVGSERSGTTLLRLMLTSHPAIAVPPEGDFLTRMHADQPTSPGQRKAFIQAFLSIEKCREWGLSAEMLAEGIALLQPRTWPELAAVPYWVWLAANYPDASRWGDKNPCHIHRLPRLLAMYPAARVLHIVRDGRDVAASWLGVPFGPVDAASAGVQWGRAVLAGYQAAAAAPGRIHEVRYESLVRQPADTLRSVCDFLGEPFSPAMLGYADANQERALVPRHRLAWHANTLRPPDPARIGRWRSVLTEAQVREFERAAGSVLDLAGFRRAAEVA
jgi:hypothetical protein